MEYDYFREKNIVQYCGNYKKSTINELQKYNLSAYNSAELSTVFFINEFDDVKFIDKHAGTINIFFTKQEINKNILRLAKKSKYVFSLTEEIKNFLLQYEIQSDVYKINTNTNTNINTTISKYVNKNICIVILTCDKYNDRIEKNKEFYKSIKFDYFFLKCDEICEKSYIKENILYVSCKECYENIPKKIALAYKYLYEHAKYDYIIKIDDDIIINWKILNEWINNNFYNLDYIGQSVSGESRYCHFGKCADIEINKKIYEKEFTGNFCGGGFGYIISKHSLEMIIKNYNELYNELYEDKGVGDILRNNGIIPSFEINNKLLVCADARYNKNKINYIFNYMRFPPRM